MSVMQHAPNLTPEALYNAVMSDKQVQPSHLIDLSSITLWNKFKDLAILRQSKTELY